MFGESARRRGTAEAVAQTGPTARAPDERCTDHCIHIMVALLFCMFSLWLPVVRAFDVGAVASGMALAATAMGRSYYGTPIRLRGLPSEEESFEVRDCVPSAKGRGLFALRTFLAGDDDVIEYRGDLLSYKGLAERYGRGTINLQGKYVFELRENGLYIDAGDEQASGRARYLNHSSRRPNLSVETDLLHNRVWFRASRDIASGEELCFDYGPRYWEGWSGQLFDDDA